MNQQINREHLKKFILCFRRPCTQAMIFSDVAVSKRPIIIKDYCLDLMQNSENNMNQINNHPLYRSHNLDTAMGSLWNFYKTRFLLLFIVSFVMSLVMQYISSFMNVQELYSTTDPMEVLEKMKGMLLPILGISVVNLLFNVILQYYVLYNPLDSSVNIFVAALRSLKYFIPYLVVIILLAFVGSIAIVLGILLLVVGAVFAIMYVMTLYLFILPIMMIEGPHIGNTVTRTITLAHRNFWANLGWVGTFIIIVLVISVISSGIILIPFTGNFIKSIVNPGEAGEIATMTQNPLYIILSSLAGALTMPLIPIFSSILYFNSRAREELRLENEQSGPEDRPLRVEDLYAKPYADDHPDNPDNKISDKQSV